MDGLALMVRHLDADRALAGHALDQDALGTHREAEVFGQAGNAAVFHAGFGLELIRRDHGPGIDLHHLAAHIELAALLHEDTRFFAQFVFAHGLRSHAGIEQCACGQLKAAHVFRRYGYGADVRIGALMDGDHATPTALERAESGCSSRNRSIRLYRDGFRRSRSGRRSWHRDGTCRRRRRFALLTAPKCSADAEVSQEFEHR